MSNFNWTEAPAWMPEAALYADLSDEATRREVYFCIKDRDGEAFPMFVVNDDDHWYTTESTEDWPVIEKFVPREEWPEPMYVGQHGPKTRTPDLEIKLALMDYIEDLTAQAE